MNDGGTWRRLLTRLRGTSAKPDESPGDLPAGDELARRRCLERMAGQGMSLWHDEPEHCDGCGRELLLGERALLLSRGEDLLLACPLCAERLSRDGYRAATPDAGIEPGEERRLTLAG